MTRQKKKAPTKKVQKKPVNKKNTKNKKGRKRKKVAKSLLLCIVVVGILFMGYRIIDLVRKPTNTVMVQNGSISLDEGASAYIIRREIVVEGDSSGRDLNQIKHEGEKVAKGGKIFNYYSDEQEEITAKISELNRQISESLETENKIFSSDIKTLEKQIENNLEKLHKMNNFSEIEEYKKQLSLHIDKKSKIIGDASSKGSYVKELISQKEGLEKQLVEKNKDVTSPKSGMVSYRIDGFEAILSPDDFKKITKENLLELDIKTSAIIPISNENAKIIDNFENYIVVMTNSEEAKNAQVNTNIMLRLSNAEEISAKIVHINEEEDCRVIIFRITNKLDELTKYRKIQLDIIWWSRSGLKVPNSTIMNEDNKDFVIRNRAGYLDKIPVNVLSHNENYSIIENCNTEKLKELGYTLEEIKSAKNISIYDEIINHPTPEMIK